MSDEAVEILLVEDSPDDVAFLVRTFGKANLAARLHVVADGKEALDFVFCTGSYASRNSGNRPKVIFLDMKMPKVGGLEVLRRLKSDPTTQTIPIVALSSSIEERDLVESYRHGVNSYIVKPMDFDQFASTVRLIGQYWLELNQTPKL
jgi:two-component system, response regulator